MMISIDDPYKTLNIKKDASKSEIRKAYRTLVKEWHPDINHDDPSAEERFKEIQQAYNFLISDKPDNSQEIEKQESNFYSAVQDHPFHSLRDAVIKYYEDTGWLKNNARNNQKE